MLSPAPFADGVDSGRSKIDGSWQRVLKPRAELYCQFTRHNLKLDGDGPAVEAANRLMTSYHDANPEQDRT